MMVKWVEFDFYLGTDDVSCGVCSGEDLFLGRLQTCNVWKLIMSMDCGSGSISDGLYFMFTCYSYRVYLSKRLYNYLYIGKP